MQTMWFLLTTHFGMRARQEHHTLSMENFFVDVSDDNQLFKEFHEDPTKTRGSGLHPTERSAVPKMFATGGLRCPVRLFQLYMSKRPADLEMTGPFYLSAKHWANQDDTTWFTRQPAGKNTISAFMKQIVKGTSAEESGKKISNHSGRKTCVKKLKRAQVPEESIIKVTGHKSAKVCALMMKAIISNCKPCLTFSQMSHQLQRPLQDSRRCLKTTVQKLVHYS